MKMVKRVSPMMWGEAPAAILVCIDLTRSRMPPEAWTGDAAGFPSQNIMLSAYSLGLGTCAIGGFNKKAVRNLLEISEEMAPLLLITVGYPNEKPEVRPRRAIQEIAYLDSCKKPWRVGGE
jgi:nitroreductase